MTGQARVIVRDYGIDIRVECIPCRIDSPSTWPRALDGVRAHNTVMHPRSTT